MNRTRTEYRPIGAGIAVAVVVLAAILLASCGPGTGLGANLGTGTGTGTGTGSSTTPSGSGVAGFARGVITAKGSIFVNGIEYDTTGSTTTVDNAAGSDADLQVGMVVTVRGTIDPTTGRGTAAQIEYAKSIEGTIDSVNATTGVIVVFGVTVTTNSSTVYRGVTDLTGLVVGDLVEVSGAASGSGVLASMVEKKTVVEDFNLKGTVSNLTATTFDLTTETGRVFHVTVTGSLASTVVNGAVVQVEFSSAPDASGNLTTTAAKVSVEHHLEAAEGDRTEVGGVVSDYAAGSPTTFTVEHTSVSADPSLVSGVANGVEVEVRGTMSGSVLQATEVRVHREANGEIEGPVASVSVPNKSIVLAGVTVTVDATTIFRDEDWTGHTPVQYFGIADIAAGDHLKVEAYDSGAGIVATKVERKNPAEVAARLSGPISAVANPIVTVLGVSVDTTGMSISNASAFWAAATVGKVVQISGTSSAGTITWTGIRLDD
jgi:hypothetical protein